MCPEHTTGQLQAILIVVDRKYGDRRRHGSRDKSNYHAMWR